MTTILEIKNFSKTFRTPFRRAKVHAVKEVSFSIQEGKIVGLVGANGAGKTTTMKAVTGLIRPTTGTISMFGLDTKDPAARKRLGYLPEGPYFYEHLRPKELLLFYGKLFNIEKSILEPRADALIKRVGLDHARDRKIRKFSKGMRQRIGIAQALINDPDFVILDEPQTGLDPVGRKEIRDLIVELADQGKTILFSSHILPDVEAICDQVVVMDRGTLIADGPLAELGTSIEDDIEIIVTKLSDDFEHPALRDKQIRSEATILRFFGTADINDLVTVLTNSGAQLQNLSRHGYGLESLVLKTYDASTDVQGRATTDAKAEEEE